MNAYESIWRHLDGKTIFVKRIEYSELNDTPANPFKIDNLYDEGKDLITKRLLKYFWKIKKFV